MELDGRSVPQIVDRDSGNLCPISVEILDRVSIVLIFYSKGGGCRGSCGGGGVTK